MVSLLESSALGLSKVSEGGSPEGLILDFALDSGAGADAPGSEYASDSRNVTNT
jgi:hypothetical protein